MWTNEGPAVTWSEALTGIGCALLLLVAVACLILGT